MNIKVVIVWGFAVILFLGIGIFGYFNQDILVNPEENVPTNPENRVEYDTKKCIGTNDYGNITYTFRINPTTNAIERLNIQYQAVVENIDIYADVANLNKIVNEQRINGITSQIYGTSKDVQLNLNVNLLDYDKESVNNINQDLIKSNMVVSSTTDYNEYQSIMASTLNLEFTCD